MLQQSFSMKMPLPFPSDVHIWVGNHQICNSDLYHPETGRKPAYLHVAGTCDGRSCASCDCADKHNYSSIETSAKRRFLAISPNAASYLAIDSAFLAPFILLRDGHPPARVEEWLEGRATRDEWRHFIRRLCEEMVLRSFMSDVSPIEDLPEKLILHLYVTNRCNLRCTHCYMSSGRPLEQGESDTKARIAAIDAFSELGQRGQVSFSGGEALTDPDIYHLIKYAKSKGHLTELYTNGLLIRESNVQRLVDTLDQLQISVDGTDAPTNDAIRGRGSFQRIIRAINLVDKADRKTNPGFLYRLGLTLTANNFENIETNILAFLSDLRLENPHRIAVGVVGNNGRAVDHPEVTAALHELPRIQAKVLRRFVESGRMKRPNFKINRFARSCGIGTGVTVAADGEIYPCGVTEQPSFGRIGQSDTLDAMKKVLELTETTNVDNVAGCRDCSLRYFCQGMCRVSNLHKTGSMLISECAPGFKAARVESLIAGYDGFLGS